MLQIELLSFQISCRVRGTHFHAGCWKWGKGKPYWKPKLRTHRYFCTPRGGEIFIHNFISIFRCRELRNFFLWALDSPMPSADGLLGAFARTACPTPISDGNAHWRRARPVALRENCWRPYRKLHPQTFTIFSTSVHMANQVRNMDNLHGIQLVRSSGRHPGETLFRTEYT